MVRFYFPFFSASADNHLVARLVSTGVGGIPMQLSQEISDVNRHFEGVCDSWNPVCVMRGEELFFFEYTAR